MTQSEKNYVNRLEIELEGLRLCKRPSFKPRSQQESTIQDNNNKRYGRKLWLIEQIKNLKK